jgi:hypothetical protein
MERCRYIVYIRDTYRYTGRGRSGFEMHYNKRRCKRKPLNNGYCWQHQREAEREEERKGRSDGQDKP